MNAASILADPDYPMLKASILEHTGLEYYADKDEDLAARLARRMALRRISGCAPYSRLLADPGPESERDALIGELTIGETYFFRQPEHFDLLRTTILPGIFERNRQSRKLRIWSAGCATGAEPYSISILLELEWGTFLRDWDTSILGTDINVDFLHRAEAGVFPPWALREVSQDLRDRCFKQEGRTWMLRREFRRGVTFRYGNLAAAAPFPGHHDGGFDLVLCRNVMIYFARETNRLLVSRLYDSLASEGWLLVGYAEPDGTTFSRFETLIESGATAYRKSSAAAAPLSPFTANEALVTEPSPVKARVRKSRPSPEPATKELPREPSPAEARPAAEDARILADRGQWSEAGEMCRRVLEISPLDAAAHFVLALILDHQGAAADAQAALRRALYLDRSFVMAHYHLAAGLERTGQSAAAGKAYQNALALAAGRPSEEPLAFGGGMTAAEVCDLAAMHLDLLGKVRRQ